MPSSPPTDPAILYFDGVCTLCNGAVDFIIRRDRARRFRYASLQSEAGRRMMESQGMDPSVLDTLILWEAGRMHTKSSAALRIARHLGGAWPLLGVFRLVPRFLRDPLYDWVARNRYRWFGRKESCRLPTPEERELFLG